MVNINEYQILLTVNDWEMLGEVLGDNINRLAFEATQNKYNLLEMINGKMSVDHLKNEFNLKLMNIGINYAYMYVYFKKLDGYDIYQEKDEQKLAHHFWFSYECESLMTRLFTLIDNLYHILNIHYDLKVREQLGFIKDVIKKLSDENQNLSVYLSGLKMDDRYKKAQKIRNDFTHNHSPLNMTSGFKKERNKTSLTKGEYMKPGEVVECIDDFIVLLEEITNEVKKCV